MHQNSISDKSYKFNILIYLWGKFWGELYFKAHKSDFMLKLLYFENFIFLRVKLSVNVSR